VSNDLEDLFHQAVFRTLEERDATVHSEGVAIQTIRGIATKLSKDDIQIAHGDLSRFLDKMELLPENLSIRRSLTDHAIEKLSQLVGEGPGGADIADIRAAVEKKRARHDRNAIQLLEIAATAVSVIRTASTEAARLLLDAIDE